MTTEDFYHTIIPLRDDLLRYAVSLTASSDDADDLAQETLLRLWDMRATADGSLPLTTWGTKTCGSRRATR